MSDKVDKLAALMGGFVARWGGNTFRILSKLAEELGEVSEMVALLNGDSRKVEKYRHLPSGGPQLKLAEELGDLIAVAISIGLCYGISHHTILDSAVSKFSRFSDKYDMAPKNPPE